MTKPHNKFLAMAAVFTAAAALAHLACIVVGAPAYRLMGAGEGMARLAEDGHWYPAAVTLAITIVLTIWALYALSGAGLMARLPLRKPVLCAIAAVFLLRAFFFPLLIPYVPGNSLQFWLISSAICFALGSAYLVGVLQTWSRL